MCVAISQFVEQWLQNNELKLFKKKKKKKKYKIREEQKLNGDYCLKRKLTRSSYVHQCCAFF